MSARDEYKTKLECVICGRPGFADWSEYEHPTIYSGPGTSLKRLSEGFVRGAGKDSDGNPEILCKDCKVPVLSI